MLEWVLKIHERTYKLIEEGKKTIDGRIPDHGNGINYSLMEEGQYVRFKLTESNTISEKRYIIRYIHHYDTIREMLTYEGLNCVFPTADSIEEGVERYHNFPEYKERESKYGVYAIGIEYDSLNED